MNTERIAVIGLGTMGSQIAVVFARAGFATAVVEASPERLEAGLASVRRFLDAQTKKGKLAADAAAAAVERIAGHVELAPAVASADFVVEAVPEDVQAKLTVFRAVDARCRPETILASNTSTLWVSQLAAATRRPDRVLGTHFLIPAAQTPLVEVVRGGQTSDETLRRTLELLGRCGKQTVTVADSPGFVINRLYLPMVNEAFIALETGVASAEEIDRSCTQGLGLPLGPLAAADASGLDVVLACVETLHRELGDKYRPSPLLVRLVRSGRLGRKAGRGVYEHGAGTGRS
jgi:3-hydroxybutyryl-CoA dehydrogenase